MKKFIYCFMLLSLVFISCDKEVEGCMDDCAINYNSDATEDDGSCMFSFAGTWTVSEWKVDGVSLFSYADFYYPMVAGAFSFSDDGYYGLSLIDASGESFQSAGTFTNTATQLTFNSSTGGTEVWTTTKMTCLEFDGYMYDDEGQMHEIELDWGSTNARYLDVTPSTEKFDINIFKKRLAN